MSSSTSGLILPSKLQMVSCKLFQPSVLCFSHFLVISKDKTSHQNIVRNQKLQSLNTDRYRNRNIVVCCSNVGSGPQIPSNPTPPGSWKPWILGFLLSVILPIWRGKWRPLLKLKEEVETVIETVETVTDIVEKVAEQVEKVADNIGDHLPEGRLKDAVQFVEDIAEDTADGAHLAGEFIDKVEDVVEEVEEKVESFMESKSGDDDQQLAKEETKEEVKG